VIDTISDSAVKIAFLDGSAIETNLHPLKLRHEWAEHGVTARKEATCACKARRSRLLAGYISARTSLSGFGPQDDWMIAVSATGCDCIDLEACRPHGVTMSNVRDWSTFAVAEHAFANMLALRRQLLDYSDRVRNGEWQRSLHYELLRDPLAGPADCRAQRRWCAGSNRFRRLATRHVAHLG
jgi:glycerate dehydrogenase